MDFPTPGSALDIETPDVTAPDVPDEPDVAADEEVQSPEVDTPEACTGVLTLATDAAGGSSEAQGVGLEVPAGAVAEAVTVCADPTTRSMENVTGFPRDFPVGAESGWAFAPADLEVSKPVSITLPVTGAPYESGPIPILRWRERDAAWAPALNPDGKLVLGTVVDGAVRFETTRLGELALARITAEQVECVTPEGIDCPVDLCTQDNGDAVNCDDGNLCNGAETCDPAEGCQPGQALVCNDDNICNGQETCAPKTGCIKGNALECDDGDVCTGTETCDPATGCAAGTPLACNNNDVCDGIETCDPIDGCVPGEELHCPNGILCDGEETCDAVQGCVAGTPIPGCCEEIADCGLNDPCTVTVTCNLSNNKCEFGPAPQCNDGNPCNGFENCLTGVGCQQVSPPPDCDDDNLCNGQETCHPVNGCTPGTPLVCDDGNVCNGTSTCNFLTGCVPGTPLKCDDGNLCNGQEVCDPGNGCVSGQPLECSDGKPCTGIEDCQPAVGCVTGDPPPGCCSSDAGCEDDNVCNGTAFCEESTSTCTLGDPPKCSDDNSCNGAETCDPVNGCQAGVPPECDDGNECNGKETCDPSTGCTPGTVLTCSNGNLCDGVETCDPATGCAAGVPPECNDDNPCNGVESCSPQVGCVGGQPIVCDDGNTCNGQESCDTAGGCQPGTPISCSDDNPCNGFEACAAVSGCIVLPGPGCNDHNACTSDLCHPLAGCLTTPIAGCELSLTTDPAATVSASAASGLTVVAPGNVSVTQVTITAAPATGLGGLANAPGEIVAGAHDFQPTGAIFDAPLTLTLPIVEPVPAGIVLDGGDTVSVLQHDTDLGSWIDATLDDGTPVVGTVGAEAADLTFGADHFSAYAGRFECAAWCPTNAQCGADGCGGTCGSGCDDEDPCTLDACDATTFVCVHTPRALAGCASCLTSEDCPVVDSCTVATCAPGGLCEYAPKDCGDDNACTVDACRLGACVNTPLGCTAWTTQTVGGSSGPLAQQAAFFSHVSSVAVSSAGVVWVTQPATTGDAFGLAVRDNNGTTTTLTPASSVIPPLSMDEDGKVLFATADGVHSWQPGDSMEPLFGVGDSLDGDGGSVVIAVRSPTWLDGGAFAFVATVADGTRRLARWNPGGSIDVLSRGAFAGTLGGDESGRLAALWAQPRAMKEFGPSPGSVALDFDVARQDGVAVAGNGATVWWQNAGRLWVDGVEVALEHPGQSPHVAGADVNAARQVVVCQRGQVVVHHGGQVHAVAGGEDEAGGLSGFRCSAPAIGADGTVAVALRAAGGGQRIAIASPSCPVATPSSCTDGDPCTLDVCDVASGQCSFEPLDGESCDDAQPCTPVDTCIQGTCTGTFSQCEGYGGVGEKVVPSTTDAQAFLASQPWWVFEAQGEAPALEMSQAGLSVTSEGPGWTGVLVTGGSIEGDLHPAGGTFTFSGEVQLATGEGSVEFGLTDGLTPVTLPAPISASTTWSDWTIRVDAEQGRARLETDSEGAWMDVSGMASWVWFALITVDDAAVAPMSLTLSEFSVCATVEGCDDLDPCTADSCQAEICQHESIPGCVSP